MSVLPSEVESVFEFKGNINFGANGTIYRVKKRSNHKYYAMKIITIRHGDGENSKNLELERKILSELNNPYLVHLDSYFEVQNNVFMVMEYCENRDLLTAITDKKVKHQEFDEDEIWHYFIQTSFGLEALHDKGYIHRDIKPENILLDENNDVKLGDFGLSRYLQASSVGGTPPYWSPRMCRDEAATKESDIWALGCVLYYLCNLEDPFKGNKGKIQNEPHRPINSQYSQELRSFVDWCLQKKRSDRPKINQIITNEFIVNKTISLGIRIPNTSDMSSLYQSFLYSEEKNRKLESELSGYYNMVDNQSAEIEPAEIERSKEIIDVRNKGLENSRRGAVERANSIKGQNNYKEQFDARKNKRNANDSRQDLNKKINDNQITSLYLTKQIDDRTKLIIYDTESERIEEKTLDVPELLNYCTCITQLPNGELFCYGNYSASGITVIIDKSYGVRILPSGTPCRISSGIYFNDCVYCFGGLDHNDIALSLFGKFDLNDNRWIEDLNPMPQFDYLCSCVIFNGNILIAGFENLNILRYSVDSDAFSTIPYEFAEGKRKILINVERLYLIEWERDGFIYESEAGDDSVWKKISNSAIGDYCPWQVYCSYNKGGIYIATQTPDGYYKFDLSQKIMIKLQ